MFNNPQLQTFQHNKIDFHANPKSIFKLTQNWAHVANKLK
jgi:hypothetical protein